MRRWRLFQTFKVSRFQCSGECRSSSGWRWGTGQGSGGWCRMPRREGRVEGRGGWPWLWGWCPRQRTRDWGFPNERGLPLWLGASLLRFGREWRWWQCALFSYLFYFLQVNTNISYSPSLGSRNLINPNLLQSAPQYIATALRFWEHPKTHHWILSKCSGWRVCCCDLQWCLFCGTRFYNNAAKIFDVLVFLRRRLMKLIFEKVYNACGSPW